MSKKAKLRIKVLGSINAIISKTFRKLFDDLPQRAKETAEKNYKLWKENPFHPSLGI